MHDDTLERTSQGSGIASLLDWQTLLQIEAGEWFDEAFRGERLPLLPSVAERCRQHGLAINIEIKPTTGTDEETGRAVALAASQLWQGMTPPPLLSSFSPSALAGQFACRALHLQHEALTEDRVEAIKASGLHIMAWTVNSPYRARALLGWGVDTLCTDRIDLIDADFANS